MEKFEGGKTLKMKRTYIVTIEEIKRILPAVDSDICKSDKIECKPVEKLQERHLFKALRIFIDRFVDFTVFLAKIICRIPIVGTIILSIWNTTNLWCNKFYKTTMYFTIATYVVFIVHQTIQLNSDCALFSGLLSFFLTIFLLQYFSKHGNQIFWLLLSLLGAGISFLLLKNYLSSEINIKALRCFSYKYLGNTLTTISIIISVLSVLIKDRQLMKI